MSTYSSRSVVGNAGRKGLHGLPVRDDELDGAGKEAGRRPWGCKVLLGIRGSGGYGG